jgi:4-amino-4-deoxy-L-arabinose transferase-like glycosyltransferase
MSALPRRPLIAILAVALVARLAFVFLTPRVIHWPDGREFEAVALSIVERGTYGEQTLRPPGYPTLIAGVYALFGRDLLALRLVEAGLSVVVVAMIGVVGAGLFGATAGLLAAALAALHPVLAFLPSTQYSENTLLLVIVPAFGLLFAAVRTPAAWRWLLAGFAFGLAALVRPNTVLLLPGLALGLLPLLQRARRSPLVPALLVTAGLALAVSPWLVRNHQVHGRWFFVATGGGRQFWVGNDERATAATTAPTQLDSAMTAELMSLPDEVARERHFYRRGFEFVREHPDRAARLYLIKLGNLFALWPETFSRTQFVNPWSRMAQGLASAVIFAGALIALARRWRSDPWVWPLVGAIATFALGNAVFFTVLRYRMAFEPCLLWLAGAGWAAVIARSGYARLEPAPESAPRAAGVSR